MPMKSIVKRTFLILLILSIVERSSGGGINIEPKSVRLNGYLTGVFLSPREVVSMQYTAIDYSYSGDNYEYYLFLIKADGMEPIYILQVAADHKGRNQVEFYFELGFTLPSQPGKYTISYNSVPIFTNTALGKNTPGSALLLDEKALGVVKNHLRAYRHLSDIYSLTILDPKNEKEKTPEIYLQVNGKTPAIRGITEKDLSQPSKFSWYVRNRINSTTFYFQYRLSPDEENWTPWTTAEKAEYYFIPKGNHSFEVKCKYRLNGIEKITNSARYAFELPQALIAEPKLPGDSQQDVYYIDKGEVTKKVTSSAQVVKDVYDKSRALIIGVKDYADKTWVKLPYISNDLERVQNTFTSMGFEVLRPKAQTRSEILTQVSKVISTSGKNDRLIIYISSHGFVQAGSNKPFITCSDCYRNNTVNCIKLDDLKDAMMQADKKIKHVLLILDCCTAGIGLLEKSSSLGGLKTLATQNGFHILTAGLGEQNARMSHEKKMSTFTYYLTEGLKNKNADYTKDGIITLTELLIYVQFMVGNATSSAQVPSLGRIAGLGEMIFE